MVVGQQIRIQFLGHFASKDFPQLLGARGEIVKLHQDQYLIEFPMENIGFNWNSALGRLQMVDLKPGHSYYWANQHEIG